MLDVVADSSDGSVHVFNDVGAGQRAAQLGGQPQTIDGKDFICLLYTSDAADE